MKKHQKNGVQALLSLIAVAAILVSMLCLNITGASAEEVMLDADGDGQALKVSVAAGSNNVSSKAAEVTELDPTKTYEVTVWVKSTGALRNANVWVDLYSAGTKITGASKNTGTLLKNKVDEWTKCVMTGITGADSVKIGLWTSNTDGATDVEVYLDAISIAEQAKVVTVSYGSWGNSGNYTATTTTDATDDQDGDGKKHVVSVSATGAQVNYNKSIWVSNLDLSKSYKVELWYKTTGWRSADITLKGANFRESSSANDGKSTAIKTAASEWTKMEFTGVRAGADGSAVNVGVGLYLSTNADTADYSIEIDNFTFTEEVTSTPVALSKLAATYAAVVEMIETVTTTTTEAATTTTTTVVSESGYELGTATNVTPSFAVHNSVTGTKPTITKVTDATDDQNGDGAKTTIVGTAAAKGYIAQMWTPKSFDATKKYTVTVWVKKGATTGSAKWDIIGTNDAGTSNVTVASSANFPNAESGWTKYEFANITPKAEGDIAIKMYANLSDAFSIEVDAITVTEQIPVTTTTTTTTTEAATTTTTTTVVTEPGEVINVSYGGWGNSGNFTVETTTDATDDKNGDGVKHVISVTGTGSKIQYNKSIWVQKLDPNKTYTLTMWYKTTGWDNADLTVKGATWRANGAGNSGFDVDPKPNFKAAKSEWTKVELTGLKAGVDTKGTADTSDDEVNIGLGLWLRTKEDTAAYTMEIDCLTLTEEVEVATTTTTTTTANGETTTTTTTAAGPEPTTDADGDNQALKITVPAGTANLGSGEYILEGLDKKKTYKVTLYLENTGAIRNGNFWVNYTEEGADAVTKKQTEKELQGSLDAWTKCTIEGITNTTSIKMGLWLSNGSATYTATGDMDIYLDGVVVEEVGGASQKIDLTKFIKAGIAAEIVAFGGETVPTTTKTPDSAKYSDVIDIPNYAFYSGNSSIVPGGYVSDTALRLDMNGNDVVGQAIALLNREMTIKNGVYDISFWVKMTDLKNGDFYAIPDGEDVEGRRGKIILKNAIDEWTQITVEGVEVKNGDLKLGFWAKGGAEGQYMLVDGMQIKLRGSGFVKTENVYGQIINVKNTDFNLGDYGMLASGGKNSSTKILITGADDFKNDSVYMARDLEPGTYTVTAWVKSGGGHNKANLYANPDPSVHDAESTATFTILKIDEWMQLEIKDIEVGADGLLKIGMWVNTKAGGWVEFSDVQIKRVTGQVASGDSDVVVPVALIVLSALALGAISVVTVSRKQTAC